MLRSLHLMLAIGIACSLLSSPASAQTPAADYWDRFEFEGNQAFTSTQLRDALLADPDFLLAAHPLGASDELASVIRKQLVAGYRRQGFLAPGIRVQASEDPVAALVTIDEGPQIRVGNVRIHASGQLDPEVLRKRLTEPFPKSDAFPTFVAVDGKPVIRWVDRDGKPAKLEKPIWKPGEPVPLDTESSLHQAVVKALTDLGYSDALVFTRLEIDEDSRTCELVVQLAEEGPANRADAIEITGVSTNTPEQVRRWIGWQPGQVVDQQRIAEITQRLWHSGRFPKHLVRFERDAAGAGKLVIELEESPGVPSLDESLNELADVFQRTGRWLGDLDQRGEDVVITYEADGHRLRAVQSQRGMLLHYTRLSDSVPPRPLHHWALLMDEQQVAILHSQHPQKWAAALNAVTTQFRFRTKIHAAGTKERLFGVNLNFNWNNKRPADQPVLQHAFDVRPADWIPFAYKPNFDCQIRDGVLVGTRGDDHIRIDAESGQILNWNSADMRVQFVAGALEKERAALLELHASKANAYDSLRPISSFAAYLSSEPIWSDTDALWNMQNPQHPKVDPALRSAIEKLIAGGLLAPVDAVANHWGQGGAGERFFVPSEPPKGVDWQGLMRMAGARVVLRLAPQVLPEDGWPLTVTREACLVALGRTKHTSKVLQQLHRDPDCGPLCHATVAYLLSKINYRETSLVAGRGLEQMTAEAFASDWDTLFAGASGQWLRDMLLTVGSLTDQERDALLERVGDGAARQLLVRLGQQTGQGRGEPGEAVYEMAELPLKAWFNSLQ